ncbi:MAG: sigma-54 dependent transcriptional regulator [Planctomycetota bacterium]|nr:sigma-54 dependent transcriptional regulator [Planctomycetota bacterium]
MDSNKSYILIIDDDPGVCRALAELAGSMGLQAETASDAGEGMRKLTAGDVDVVVLDIQLPGFSGLDALPKIKADYPDLPVIVITAFGTMETAITAIQRGAFEYLLKPVDMDVLKTVLRAAIDHRRRSAELSVAEPPPVADSAMIGRCPEMQEVFKQVAIVSATDMPVLIQGQTGTGKELLGRAIHRYSSRSAGPFVAVNCSLLSGELIASELFGHEKGAFTGATRACDGKVVSASGGTLLLDEVGDLSAEAQARLLRFLDDGEFYRVGSTQPRRADVRIIAATNRTLRAAALSGQFRRDLYFRISGVVIELPPLNQRGEDINLLMDYFLAGCGARGITDRARGILNAYTFPGNVRELRNIIIAAAAMASNRPVGPEHLPDEICRPVVPARADSLEQLAEVMLNEVLSSAGENGYEELISRWEKPILSAAMKRFSGNQARIADAMKMHRSTLRKKLRGYGLIEEKKREIAGSQ